MFSAFFATGGLVSPTGVSNEIRIWFPIAPFDYQLAGMTDDERAACLVERAMISPFCFVRNDLMQAQASEAMAAAANTARSVCEWLG